jgi:hypothetical protein
VSLTADLEFSSTASGTAAWQLVIEQGGVRYYSVPFNSMSQGGWRTVTITNLSVTDFDTNPWAKTSGILPNGTGPNFTTNGLPLRFGFMFGNRVLFGSSSITSTFGLDNFTVNIFQAPQLTLVRQSSPNAVKLIWPTNASGYQLEFVDILATNVWTKATNVPVTVGTNFTVTANIIAANRFFRLRKP